MKKITNLLFLIIFTIVSCNFAIGNNNSKYTNCVISIDQSNCSAPVSEKAIIEKEFGNTNFVLDLSNKKLIRIIDKQEKTFDITMFENNKISLIDKLDGYTLNGEYVFKSNQLVLKLKEKEDECFSLFFTFSY